MARIANSTKEETHQRIVEVAAKALRREGYGGTGVAAVMKEAGLTHGGFYAHFASRDDLLVEALERAGAESRDVVAQAIERGAANGVSSFRALVDAYLADSQLNSMETGCPVAALGCDMPRQSRPVRKASANGVQKLIEAVATTLSPGRKDAAAAVTGTLVGSLQLARAVGDNPAGRAILADVRTTLLRTYDAPKPSR